MGRKKSAPKTSAPVNSSSSSEYEYEEVEKEVKIEVEEEGSIDEEEDEEEEGSNDESSSESEEEDENTKRETLRKLLEPLCKEQIIAFLKEAAERDSSIISRIAKSTESDPVHRRIFVHGLCWDATKDQVLTIFTQYGEIEDCKVVMDKITGKAKGYAFILFKTKGGAKKALKQPQKKIGNRMTSCQLSSTGGISQSQEHTSGRKIFVANVSRNINSYKLLSLFSTYGEIEEGPLGRDSITGKFKGFAIFIYKTAEGCRKALEDPIKIFEGQQLECRLATEGASRPNKIKPLVAAPASSSIQQSDLGAMSYGFGLNPALLAHYNMNPAAAAAAAAVLLSSNSGIGFANPMMAAAQGLSQSSLAPAAAGLGLSSNYGIIPSVMGNYGSQVAALQGLGVYQNAQSGHSSAAASTSAAEPQRPQPNFGSSAANNYPLYFSR